MSATTPAVLSFAGFAELAGYRRSYITQLKRDGRLVLTDDGKAVRVRESLARIAATRDPSKDGVAARHAAARQQAAATPAPAPYEAPPPRPSAASADPSAAAAGSSYQNARAVRERFLALQAKLEYERAVAKLLDAGAVEAAASSAVTLLRSRLEALPDILGPQLAPITDEAQLRATLAEAIEHALDETARQFSSLAKAAP